MNYSKKHHPQDYGLPGHRPSAIMPPPVAKRDPPKPSQSRRKRKAAISELTIPDSDEDDEDAIESVSARLSDDEHDGQGISRKTPARQPLRSISHNGRPAKRRRRSDRKSTSPQVVIDVSSDRNSSSISDVDTDMEGVNQLVDTFTAVNDSPAKSSSQAEASSVTLDGTASPKNVVPVPFVFAIVKPYLGPTLESCQSADGSTQAGESSESPNDSSGDYLGEHQTTNEPRNDSWAASEPQLGFHSLSEQRDADAETRTMSEHRESSTTTSGKSRANEQSQATGSPRNDTQRSGQFDAEVIAHMVEEPSDISGATNGDDKADSRTMGDLDTPTCEILAGRRGDTPTMIEIQDTEVVPETTSQSNDKAQPSTMSERNDAEAEFQPTSEQREPETGHSSTHFDEAMAFVEQFNAEAIQREVFNEDVAEQSSQVDEMPVVAKTMQSVSSPVHSSGSGTSDPIDLLPKLSSCCQPSDSLPSTAEPESDRFESNDVDVAASAMSTEL